ncbi:hypothetical protein PUN28_011606 [Cardiocondyla obscurior]|uniref:Uncharacterized protein n=1 Tax=Cardiocondyla obscurior TaxID=286306 RepID=A0AAW2FES3_9HYME
MRVSHSSPFSIGFINCVHAHSRVIRLWRLTAIISSGNRSAVVMYAAIVMHTRSASTNTIMSNVVAYGINCGYHKCKCHRGMRSNENATELKKKKNAMNSRKSISQLTRPRAYRFKCASQIM